MGRFCTSMLSSSIYLLLCCSTPSTAQHSAISPHKDAKQARADQRATTQSGREHLLYCSTASTAQHSPISPHKAAKQVRADQSATAQQADRVGESQHMPSSTCTTRLVLKTNVENEIHPAYKNIQLLTRRWCDS